MSFIVDEAGFSRISAAVGVGVGAGFAPVRVLLGAAGWTHATSSTPITTRAQPAAARPMPPLSTVEEDSVAVAVEATGPPPGERPCSAWDLPGSS